MPVPALYGAMVATTALIPISLIAKVSFWHVALLATLFIIFMVRIHDNSPGKTSHKLTRSIN